MLKYIVLGLVIILALDGFFRDGELVNVFFSQEFYFPVILRIAFMVIAIVAVVMLLHAIVWDLNILPKPSEKKTDLQLQREFEEEQARIEQEEREKAEGFEQDGSVNGPNDGNGARKYRIPP